MEAVSLVNNMGETASGSKMKQRLLDWVKIGILIFLQTIVSIYAHKG